MVDTDFIIYIDPSNSSSIGLNANLSNPQQKYAAEYVDRLNPGHDH
jgi:hypothetical protein